MNRLILAALLLAAGPVTAQRTFRLPKGWEQSVDRNYDFLTGTGSRSYPARVQQLYDPAELPLPVVSLKQVAFRRNNFFANRMAASTTKLDLVLSVGPNTPSTASATFASNHGTNKKTAFTGTVNWPASPFQKGVVAPHNMVVKFARPFIVIRAAGKSVVLDWTLKSTSHSSTLLLDGAGPNLGSRTNNGSPPSSCRFSNGKFNSGLGTSLGGLTNNGGTWSVSYSNLLPNAPGIITISSFGIANRGNWPLPINLAGLGMPGCTWHVGLELALWIPILADARGTARLPTLQIPPGLGGGTFYDHGLVLDKKANAAGWVTTWSSGWKIGSGNAPSATTVYRLRNSANSPTGFVRKKFVAIIEGKY